MSLALGLDKDALMPLFQSDEQEYPHWVLKLISYPLGQVEQDSLALVPILTPVF